MQGGRSLAKTGYRFAAIVIFATAIAGNSAAQPGSPWRFWDSHDGFMESYTSGAVRNPDGSVWIKHGMLGPIERLDGYSAPHYPEPGGSGDLETAPDGTLWIWAAGQIKRFDGSHWQAWNVDEIPRLGSLRGNAFESSDIIYFKSKAMRGTIHVAALDRSHALILLPDRILEFDAEMKSARTVLGTAQAGLKRFVSIADGHDGTLIVTGAGGMGRIRAQEAEWHWEAISSPPGFAEFDFPFPDKDALFVTGITPAAVTAALSFDGHRWKEIYRGDSRNLRAWAGDEGTVWVQDGNHAFQIAGHRRTAVPRTETLSGILLSATPEGKGRFWINSSQGLAHYMPPLWQTPTDAPVLDDVVNAITEDPRGRVWFLAAHSLICLANGKWLSYPLPRGETAWAIFTQGLGVLADGRIVIRTTSAHLTIFDPAKNTFSIVLHPLKYTIRMLAYNPGGPIMAETHSPFTGTTQIEIFDGSRFLPFLGPDKTGGQRDIRTVGFGPAGEVLAGSTSAFGIWTNGKYHPIGSAEGFVEQGAYAVHCTPEGTMIAGGRDALYRLDGTRWRKLQSGLDRVRNIITARDGALWVASGTGVHRYLYGNWISNGVDDGLPSSVVYKIFEDSRGRIWAGTTRGLSLFHPEADKDPPIAVIDEDQNPKEAPPGGDVHLLFSGVDKWKFTLPGRLLFSWRMDGSAWTPFVPVSSASFTRLLPGGHRFEVRAMDRNGNISVSLAGHNFTVMVPWYSTSGFRWLALAAGILILLLITLASLNYSHRGRLIVELNRKNRLERERQKILQMIAGREPLSSILLQIASGISTNCPGAACVSSLDRDSDVEVLSLPALPESIISNVRKIAMGRPASVELLRSEFGRLTTAEYPGGCLVLPFGPDAKASGSFIGLIFRSRNRAARDTGWLLETFSGLAAGAVENARLYRQLGHQARHDVLTGLANRLFFEEHLENLLASRATGRPLALLYVDLDRFKQINDSLGHRVGDLFLRQVAARLSSALRSGSKLFRIGGDEFIVVVESDADRSLCANMTETS